jgi:hypothetical protein
VYHSIKRIYHGTCLVDGVSLNSRVDELCYKFAFKVLNDKALDVISYKIRTQLAYLEVELLGADAQGFLAGSLEILQAVRNDQELY